MPVGMGVEHDITDCTVNELWNELASRFDCAMLVHSRNTKQGSDKLTGVDWKGTSMEALGLSLYSIVRVAMRTIVQARAAEDKDVP